METTTTGPRRIRVTYVINSLGVGGAERLVCDLARHLDPDRFEAQVLCLYHRGQFAPAVEAAGVPVHVIDVKRRVVPANWGDVWRSLGEARADIVHTHLHEAAWYGLPSAYLRRVPVRISHLHSSHWNWPRKLRWLDRAAEAFASTTLACSNDVEEFARSRLRYPAHKLEVVRNAIDLGRFRGLPDRSDAQRALGLPPGPPTVVCVASLTEQKGQGYLIDAMPAIRSELPDARLLLVGRDRGKTDLAALAHERGLGESVVFLGARDDIPLVLAASDVSVLPSLREGLPMSLLESAAAGVPVVATAVGGIPEVVEAGSGGILVPPREPAPLAEAVVALLRDPELRRSMGEAARERVEREFDLGVMTARVQDLYGSLLAASRRLPSTVSR